MWTRWILESNCKMTKSLTIVIRQKRKKRRRRYYRNFVPHWGELRPGNVWRDALYWQEFCRWLYLHGLPRCLSGWRSPYNAEDFGLIPGEGNDNPLQCSHLENPMDSGAWWAIAHGLTKSRTWRKQLMHAHAWIHRATVAGLFPLFLYIHTHTSYSEK